MTSNTCIARATREATVNRIELYRVPLAIGFLALLTSCAMGVWVGDTPAADAIAAHRFVSVPAQSSTNNAAEEDVRDLTY